MADARFEDARPESPLRLTAETADDLTVIASLLQDAVAQTSDMSWLKRKHKFALLLNRFRWEDREAAEIAKRPYERVQSMLVIDGVLATRSQGIDPEDKSIVLELLSISFDPAEDGSGTVSLVFSGDGAIALDVEYLGVSLRDMSRPYIARTQRVPKHPELD